MMHKVRKRYSDSDATHGGDSYAQWENAPQGVLQGNAAGSVIWAILSSVIFSILREKGFCDNFIQKLFELVGFAFVDDADLIQSGEDADGLLEKTQLLLDEWRELMAVTAVNPIFILSITVKIKENGKPLTWILEMQSYQF